MKKSKIVYLINLLIIFANYNIHTMDYTKEALDACSNKSEGESCTFSHNLPYDTYIKRIVTRTSRNGICKKATDSNSALICEPEHFIALK